jgi:hypothetical protein
MTQPTNTFDTFDQRGLREDLTDIIYDISPTLTPFMNNIGRVNVTNTLHEWQTDTLAAVSTSNAKIQGDDKTGNTISATSRLQNRTQISDKTIVVSGTSRAVDPAGREDELSYQVVKAANEIKRDIEAIMTRNQAINTGNSTSASLARTLESWITTNTSRGSSGANGSTTAAATDGTQRDLTENLVKDVLQQCFNSGGEPDMITVGAVNKQKFSEFAGNATRFEDSKDQKLVTSIDVYVSDFGTLKVMPNRFQRERTLFVLQTDLWAMGMLRPFMEDDLAKTGDSDKRLVLAEWTLESRNEAGSGVVADLSTS